MSENTWRRPWERFVDACVRQNDHHGGGSVMVWGGIHLHGISYRAIWLASGTGTTSYGALSSPHCKQWDLVRFSRMTTSLHITLGWWLASFSSIKLLRWTGLPVPRIWHPSRTSGTSSAAVFMTIIPSSKPRSAVPVPSAGVKCHPSTDSGDTGPVHKKKMCWMPHGKWRFYALLTVLKCTDWVFECLFWGCVPLTAN